MSTVDTQNREILKKDARLYDVIKLHGNHIRFNHEVYFFIPVAFKRAEDGVEVVSLKNLDIPITAWLELTELK